MRLLAVSDLHLTHRVNRAALAHVPGSPDDWLILAGDVGDRVAHLDHCLATLAPRFAKIVWVPGNHDLWARRGTDGALRGEERYRRLVDVARGHGALTPEDPYPVLEIGGGRVAICPLFVLYDYSFRPREIAAGDVVAWAAECGHACADEHFLDPAPHASRGAWCAERVGLTEARLSALPPDVDTILVNHFPLEERHAVLPRVPRFTPWCGTRLTAGWHLDFRARAVVFGHLHIRGTRYLDGVPFQEVSLGYPVQWNERRGIAGYIREVDLAPPSAAAAIRGLRREAESLAAAGGGHR